MRKIPYLITDIYQSTHDPRLLHCLLPDRYPFGDHELWEVQFPVAPIDGRYPDSSALKIVMASLQWGEVGEFIVSEFLFTSANALLIYAQHVGKTIQFEYHGEILRSVLVEHVQLDRGMREVYPLLQINPSHVPSAYLLQRYLQQHGSGTVLQPAPPIVPVSPPIVPNYDLGRSSLKGL